jgi:hypothetical protein
LGTNYGSNPDAWRVVIAARHLTETGIYTPSRFPGYPLPEYFYAFLWKVGLSSPFLFDLPAAILSGVIAGLFFNLVLPLGYLRAAAISLALAFTPIFFIAGTQSIDYVWGLTFFVASALAAFRDDVLVSGVLLGFAAASRPTYALAYVPLALTLLKFRLDRRVLYDRLSKLLPFTAVAAGVAITFYAPLFYEYGVSFLTFSGGIRSLSETFRTMTIGVFGSIGTIGIAAALITSIVTFFAKGAVERDHSRFLLFALITAAIYCLIFFRVPHQAAYLLPVLPALYIWLGLSLPTRWLLPLGPVLVASCFLNIGHEGVLPRLKWNGPVLADRYYRHSLSCIASEVTNAAHSLDDDTYIVAGHLKPTLMVLAPPSVSRHLIYAIPIPHLASPFHSSDSSEEGTRLRNHPNSQILVIDRASSYAARDVPVAGTIETVTTCPG